MGQGVVEFCMPLCSAHSDRCGSSCFLLTSSVTSAELTFDTVSLFFHPGSISHNVVDGSFGGFPPRSSVAQFG